MHILSLIARFSQIDGIYTENGNGLKRVITPFGYQKRVVTLYQKQPSIGRMYRRPVKIFLTIDNDCEGTLHVTGGKV